MVVKLCTVLQHICPATYSHRRSLKWFSAWADIKQKTAYQMDIAYEELMCSFGECLTYSTLRVPTVSKSHRATHKSFTAWLVYSGSFTVEYKHSPGRAYGRLSINQVKEKRKEATLNSCVWPWRALNDCSKGFGCIHWCELWQRDVKASKNKCPRSLFQKCDCSDEIFPGMK